MNKSNLRFLKYYLKKYTLLIVISLLLTLISSLLTLMIPYIVGTTIDLLVGVNLVDVEKVLTNGLIILGLSIVITLSQYFIGLINNSISFKVAHDIRRDINDKIHRLPLKYLDNEPIGSIVSKIIIDVDVITEGLILGFNSFFSSLVSVVTALIIMFVLNYKIALVVFILTPISLLLARFISSSTFKLFKKQSELRSEQTSFLNEMISSQKIVQELGYEEESLDKFTSMNEEYQKVSLKAVFFSSMVNPITRFINSIIYSSVALVGALFVVDSTTLKVGLLVTFLSYVNQYTKPFNELTGVISELQNAFASTSKVKELLSEQEESKDEVKVLNEVEGNIDINNVTFAYEPNQRLIENLNLNIKKGTKVAIVGPTGSGKTTLINLLMRFYDPVSGDISIDKININEVTRHSLRDNFGMVLQETWLKEASILDNVRIGKEDATREEVIEALKEAHAYKFVEQLEEGIDTIIKEDNMLSVGQKQLLCVARIMLTKPPLLILDEATSSIDTRTEKRIQRGFNKLMDGRTSFIVAHRLSTIENADLILVMKNGNVIEQGNHRELLEKKGFYYELYHSQFI